MTLQEFKKEHGIDDADSRLLTAERAFQAGYDEGWWAAAAVSMLTGVGIFLWIVSR